MTPKPTPSIGDALPAEMIVAGVGQMPTQDVLRHQEHAREIVSRIYLAMEAVRVKADAPIAGELEGLFRLHLWNALRKEVSLVDDACYRVINRAWDDLNAALNPEGG